jgi:L-threonylcarbamoyladenylate synthase
VIAAKKRKDNKPILVIIHSVENLDELVAEIPSVARVLMKQFWPGPLTIVFKAKPGLPFELTQGSGTIGVRIPSNTFCLELLRRCGCPLTSTSANISGEPVHRTIAEIRTALNEGVDLFLDAGTLPVSKPSTLISVAESSPTMLREGVISFEETCAVLPDIRF